MGFLEAIRWDVIWDYRELFIKGMWTTLYLTLVGIIFGLILGLLFGIGKISKKKWIRWPCSIYIDVVRGTPLLVQIMLVHFAVMPTVFSDPKGPVVSGMVALSLNSAAYIAEIFRAGIQSIDRGQMEAVRSLGMRHTQSMIHVILPQAFKRMIPPLGNEFITLLKDSSLVAVIAASELLYAGRMVAAAKFRPWEAYLTVMALYLVLTLIFSRLLSRLERKLDYDRRS